MKLRILILAHYANAAVTFLKYFRQHPVHPLLPGWQHQAKGLLQFGVAQP
jgi:hypothetical protein